MAWCAELYFVSVAMICHVDACMLTMMWMCTGRRYTLHIWMCTARRYPTLHVHLTRTDLTADRLVLDVSKPGTVRITNKYPRFAHTWYLVCFQVRCLNVADFLRGSPLAPYFKQAAVLTRIEEYQVVTIITIQMSPARTLVKNKMSRLLT